MENKEFNKPTMEIVDINENDVIATSMNNANDCKDWGLTDGVEEW